MLGVQEKKTFKYYILRQGNLGVVGCVDIPKGLEVRSSVYVADYEEMVVILSDKSFGRIDRKDYCLRSVFKFPENILDLVYCGRMKA
jgi:hypothetical protein